MILPLIYRSLPDHKSVVMSSVFAIVLMISLLYIFAVVQLIKSIPKYRKACFYLLYLIPVWIPLSMVSQAQSTEGYGSNSNMPPISYGKSIPKYK